MKIKTALILCAGYGKRLLPLTEDIPKPLLKVKNINLLDNTLEFLQSIGISKIKINIIKVVHFWRKNIFIHFFYIYFIFITSCNYLRRSSSFNIDYSFYYILFISYYTI